MMLKFFLILAAVLCFIAAGLNIPARVHLGWFGLACAFAVPLIAAWPG